jgi:hypothetical protein
MAGRIFKSTKSIDIFYEDLQTKWMRNRHKKHNKVITKRSPYSRFAQKHFDNDSGFIGAY